MSAPKAIVLAAGVGKRFGRRTKTLPKCLIPLGRGQNLLSRYLDSFRACGVRDVVIVCGHLKQKIKRECRLKGKGLKIRFIENPDFRKGSVLSLFKAARELNSNVLIMDADVYFPTEALRALLDSPKKNAFLADTRSTSTGEEMMLMARKTRLVSIAKKTDAALQVIGEATGILRLDASRARFLRSILSRFVKTDVSSEYEEAYRLLMGRSRIDYVKIDGHFWTEMDFEEDRQKIRRHLKLR